LNDDWDDDLNDDWDDGWYDDWDDDSGWGAWGCLFSVIYFHCRKHCLLLASSLISWCLRDGYHCDDGDDVASL
jgi:hypothetical protein